MAKFNVPQKIIDIFPPEKSKKESYFPPEKEFFQEKKIEKIESGKKTRFRKSLFLLFLFLIIGFLFLNFVLARVNIEIWPETEDLNLDEKITIDTKAKQLDLITKIIPGEIFETEKSIAEKFSTTGKTLKEKYAQGIIRVYNNYHLPQTLIATTRFQPALEKVIYFRSTKTVVIPAKSYLDVEVKADRAGEEYNIPPSTFSIPGLAGLPQYYSVYGKSFSPMTGGFKGEVSQVTQEDLEAAKNNLLEKLKKETKDYFKNESSKGFIFLDEGIFQEIIEATSSFPVGSETESFNFNLRSKIKAISFKKSDLDNFVKEFIRNRLENTAKKIKEESLKIDYSGQEADLQSGKIILKVKIFAKIYSDIDQNALKKAILGKSLKETQTLLVNQTGVNRARLNAFPFWLKRIPENQDKIRIKLNVD